MHLRIHGRLPTRSAIFAAIDYGRWTSELTTTLVQPPPTLQGRRATPEAVMDLNIEPQIAGPPTSAGNMPSSNCALDTERIQPGAGWHCLPEARTWRAEPRLSYHPRRQETAGLDLCDRRFVSLMKSFAVRFRPWYSDREAGRLTESVETGCSATSDTVRWRPCAMSGRQVRPSEFIGKSGCRKVSARRVTRADQTQHG